MSDELATRQTEARPLSSPQFDLKRLYGRRIVQIRYDTGDGCYSNHYLIRADNDGLLLVDRLYCPPGAMRFRYLLRTVVLRKDLVVMVEPTRYYEDDIEAEEVTQERVEEA